MPAVTYGSCRCQLCPWNVNPVFFCGPDVSAFSASFSGNGLCRWEEKKNDPIQVMQGDVAAGYSPLQRICLLHHIYMFLSGGCVMLSGEQSGFSFCFPVLWTRFSMSDTGGSFYGGRVRTDTLTLPPLTLCPSKPLQVAGVTFADVVKRTQDKTRSWTLCSLRIICCLEELP